MAKKIIKLMKAPEIDVPWEVWTCLYEQKPHISVLNDQVSFNGADFKSAAEMRTALIWLVEQFGGKVKWNTNE